MSQTGWVPVDEAPQGWTPVQEQTAPQSQSFTELNPRTGRQIQTNLDTENAITKSMLAIAGASATGGLAPEGSLLLRAALSAGGGGIGTSVGQAATGQNPFTQHSMIETVENAGSFGLAEMGLGSLSKLLGIGLGYAKGTKSLTEGLDVVPPAGQMQNAYANTPREVLQYAQSKGIDLTPGQATGKPVARTLEAIGERSLLGGDELAEAKKAANLKLAENIGDFMQRQDPKAMGLSEEQAGESIQQAVRVAQSVAHENASNAYKMLPPQFGDSVMDTSGIRSKYFQQLKQAEVSLANRNPQMAAQIRGVLEQGANLGTPSQTVNGSPFIRPEMKVSDLLKVRSDAIQDGNALARAGAPNEVQALYRQLSSDVDQLVQAQADKMKLTPQWRQANAGWGSYQQTFNNPSSPLYRALNQGDPAKVTRTILNNSSAAEIEQFRNATAMRDANGNITGDGPALDALKSQVISDIANRGFRVTGDGLGGYSDSFLNTLLGPEAKKELYLNGELARRMGFQLNPSGTSNVMLGAEQISPLPSKWSGPWGGAKLSMPQPAQNFLPGSSTRLRLNPMTSKLLGAAGSAATQGGTQ